MVSLGIHAVLIVIAVSFVAVRVYVKDDKIFEAKPVSRPRMKLKKLSVPVNIKKKKIQKPKLRKTIVSKPKTKSMDIKMPEISGIKGGTGYMDGGGLGGIGFALELNLFGGDKGSGNELEGTFYDLKMEPDGTPNDMAQIVDGLDQKAEKKQNDEYAEVLRNFLNSWNPSRLEKKFFKAPKSKFATTFMVPYMSAEEAPKAYGVQDVVKPKRWVAYYHGKFAAPETGRYRFRGIADDAMLVQVKGRVVIDASLGNKRYSDWESKDPKSRKIKTGRESGLVIGDWFHMTKGKPTDIEVVIGEQPGGIFYCRLLIEQDGVDYPKGKDGGPVLPIFKTQEIPEKLIPKMQIDPGTSTVDGPSFGVLK